MTNESTPKTQDAPVELPKAYCYACGHSAASHDDGGCHAPDYDHPGRECICIGFEWRGRDPRYS